MNGGECVFLLRARLICPSVSRAGEKKPLDLAASPTRRLSLVTSIYHLGSDTLCFCPLVLPP